jgi:hypothetical protein
MARSKIGMVWDEHITQAYAILEAAETLDTDQKVLHESLRVSLESIHDDIILIMAKIAAFRQIAQDSTSETAKQIHLIQKILDKLKCDLPKAPA